MKSQRQRIIAGNPCRVIRKINENDKSYCKDQYESYQDEMGE